MSRGDRVDHFKAKIDVFSAAMLSQFLANEDRDGWLQPMNEGVPQHHFDELQLNIARLQAAFEFKDEVTLQEQRTEVLACAADVANMALIIADCARAIVTPPSPEELS